MTYAKVLADQIEVREYWIDDLESDRHTLGRSMLSQGFGRRFCVLGALCDHLVRKGRFSKPAMDPITGIATYEGGFTSSCPPKILRLAGIPADQEFLPLRLTGDELELLGAPLVRPLARFGSMLTQLTWINDFAGKITLHSQIAPFVRRWHELLMARQRLG